MPTTPQVMTPALAGGALKRASHHLLSLGGDTAAIAARLRSAGAPFATDRSHREALARLDAVLAAAAAGEAAAVGSVSWLCWVVLDCIASHCIALNHLLIPMPGR